MHTNISSITLLSPVFADCNCHPEGSKQYQCDLYSGQCECNPQIVGKYCDTRELQRHSCYILHIHVTLFCNIENPATYFPITRLWH